MTEAVTLAARGLMTDPGPFTAAPDGGMVEAQNVVILRPGVIEPRPGTQWFKDSTLKSNADKASAIWYSDVSGAGFVWASSPWIIRRNGGTTITGPTSFISGKIRVGPTGGRALFTSENGICTLPDQLASPANGSSTIAYRAGMPQPYAPRMLTTAAPAGYPAGSNWLANGDSVAYRVTLRRRLDDGTVIESPPSGRVVVTNSAGAARGVTLTDPLGVQYVAWRSVASQGFGDLITGDELCVYRSPSIAGTPIDLMTLRAVLVYDVTYEGFVSIVNGTATPWFDGLSDAAFTGPPLYTNSNMEGANLANYRPEYARDIALYRGMTFYGGHKSAQTVTATLKGLGTLASLDPSQVLLTFAFTGDITSGTNTILNVTSDIYFSVGQVITLTAQAPGAATASFPADTYVTAIDTTTNTVTMSANAGATTIGAGCIAWDWIESSIAGSRIYYNDTGILGTLPNRYFTATAASLDNRWNGDLATSLQLRCEGASQTMNILCRWFRPDPEAAAFSIRSSKPFAWDKLINRTPGVTSVQDGGIAELRWTKINEPEHSPPGFRTTVGDASYAIRRIVAVRNVLLVFKDDGLYQAFGDVPNGGLSFELVDRTIVIPSAKDQTAGDEPSKWVGRYDDRVYAMTTRGPLAIGDTGGQPVGQPILESLRRRFVYAYGAFDESRRAMMVDTQSRRVGFFYDVDGTGANGSVGYMLDVDTGAWTYWKFAREIADFATIGAYNAPVFAGGYSYGLLLEDRTMLDDIHVQQAPGVSTLPSSSDQWPSETATINTVTGTGPYTVTIAAGSEWTPVVGDLLIRNSVAHFVTSIVTPGTVFTTATQPQTGACTWREGFECRCVWTARVEGNVGIEKEWFALRLPFELQVLMSRYIDSSSSIGRLKSYFRGYRNTESALEEYVDAAQGVGESPWPIEPTYKHVSVPIAVANDWALRVGFSIRQACVWFATAGVVVEYVDAGLDPGR